MAFQGYLIKVANAQNSDDWYEIPPEFIVEQSYEGTYSVMDVDSQRVATGVLNRNSVDHKVAHCKVQIKPLSGDKLRVLFDRNASGNDGHGEISKRYVTIRNGNTIDDRTIWVNMWVAELCDYVTAECYIPDITFTVKRITKKRPYTIYYKPFDLEFIGY